MSSETVTEQNALTRINPKCLTRQEIKIWESKTGGEQNQKPEKEKPTMAQGRKRHKMKPGKNWTIN